YHLTSAIMLPYIFSILNSQFSILNTLYSILPSFPPIFNFLFRPQCGEEFSLLIFWMQVFLPVGAACCCLMFPSFVQVVLRSFQMDQGPFYIVKSIERT